MLHEHWAMNWSWKHRDKIYDQVVAAEERVNRIFRLSPKDVRDLLFNQTYDHTGQTYLAPRIADALREDIGR